MCTETCTCLNIIMSALTGVGKKITGTHCLELGTIITTRN